MIDDVPSRDLSTLEAPRLGPRRASAWVLVEHAGRHDVVELPEGIQVSIGRSRSNGIVLSDRSVSRLHATLEWRGGDRILVEDHGSKNGVRRSRPHDALRSGDSIEIGPARLVVYAPRAPMPPGAVLSRSAAMAPLLRQLERASQTPLPVLLRGETGTGKELLARRVHKTSGRTGAFVAVHCGSIPSELQTSHWFGHERGAFTGAESAHDGVFRRAHGGTLFLDEVAELDPASQVSLLRALEEGLVTPVGAAHSVPVDVRLLAATQHDLVSRVESGAFRRDLLYRIDVLPIDVPPLRARHEDIGWLAQRFAEAQGCTLDDDVVPHLTNHAWPGNVRELQNAVTRAAALASGARLTVADFDLGPRGASGLDGKMATTERDAIATALQRAGGNQTRAARALGITRRALIYRMEKHGLKAAPEPR